MKIREIKDYTLYDVETTGLDFYEDRIVEHGCIRVRDNEIVDTFATIVNQPVKIPFEAERIHGISNERMAKEGISPEDAVKKTREFMGNDIIVGLNNIPFDFPMYEMECKRYGLPNPSIANWFDVGLWYKGICLGRLYNEEELFFKYALRIRNVRARVKYNLNHMAKEFGVENLRDNVGFHGAIIDLRMNHHVFQAAKKKYYNV